MLQPWFCVFTEPDSPSGFRRLHLWAEPPPPPPWKYVYLCSSSAHEKEGSLFRPSERPGTEKSDALVLLILEGGGGEGRGGAIVHCTFSAEKCETTAQLGSIVLKSSKNAYKRNDNYYLHI